MLDLCVLLPQIFTFKISQNYIAQDMHAFNVFYTTYRYKLNDVSLFYQNDIPRYV